MNIAIGSDHAGFRYKELLKSALPALGHRLTDFGTGSLEPVDYPLFVRPVAEAVAAGEFERGIVLGGSGNGEAIVANRVRGVRCTLCWSVESARLARAHNDANVLSLGERLIPESELLPIVRTWLTTSFEGDRHARRLALIDGEDAPRRRSPAGGAAREGTPAPALTPEQWEARDYRQAARELDAWAREQGGPAREDDSTEYVAKLGLNASGSVIVMSRAHDRVLVPPPARVVLAALALDGQPFGFIHDDVIAVRRAAEGSGQGETAERLKGLAARMERLLPPAGA
jgi:ribose 5-phosphate isomerase B